MGELIFVHLGQCGCQIGSRLWKLFSQEHFGLSESEQPASSSLGVENNLLCLFDESMREDNKYHARSLFIDSDMMVVDQLKKDETLGGLVMKENLLGGCEDSSSNFVRAMYSLGREYNGYIVERMRKMLERCDSAQGIIFTQSINGGTGSGFSAMLSSSFLDFKVPMSSFCVFPSNEMATLPVEPYNNCLSLNDLKENIRTLFCLENEPLYNICKGYGIAQPNYQDINDIISQGISTFLSPFKFPTGSGKNFRTLTEKLIPIGCLCLISNTFTNMETNTTDLKANELLSSSKCMNSVNYNEGTSISLNVSMRGNFSIDHAKSIIDQFRDENILKFLPGFQNNTFHCVSPGKPSNIGNLKFSNIVHTANNTSAITKPLEQIISKFDTIYKRRAYYHWFVGEGLESGEMDQCRHSLQILVDDYKEMEKNNIHDILRRRF